MNYKININPKMPSDKVIEKHKNFEKLHAEYLNLGDKRSEKLLDFLNSPEKSEPKVRTLKQITYTAIGIAAAFLIGFLILKTDFSTSTPITSEKDQVAEKTEKETTDPVKEQTGNQNLLAANNSQTNPPFEGVDIDFENYNVNGDKGTIIDHKNGSRLVIPANAFIDENGNPIAGNIEIRYREMHDPVDFFISGVAMTYDSAGSKYHFESAGMMEIQAFKDKEEVFLKPEAAINVELASAYDDQKDYNIYHQDNESSQWKYKGKDNNIVTKNMLAEQIKAVNKEIGGMLQVDAEDPDMPLKPRLADENNFKISIDFNPGEFPEIAAYKNSLFEVDPKESPDFDSDFMYNTVFEDIKLVESDVEDKYKMRLLHEGKTYEHEVYPVFEQEDYEEALAQYETNLEKYNQLVEEKELAMNSKKEAQKEEIEQLDQKKTFLKERLARLNNGIYSVSKGNELAQLKQKDAVSRRLNNKAFHLFAVNEFGIWNCGIARSLPAGPAMAASFTNIAGTQLQPKSVFMVDLSTNALFSYTPAEFEKFRFNPASRNIAWFVTEDNKLAVLRQEAFDKVQEGNSSHNFKVEVADRKFKAAPEIRQFLGVKIEEEELNS